MRPRIRLAKPTFFGEEVGELKRILQSGWWSQGAKVAEFEREFAKFVGSRYAVATPSCTTALQIAIQVSVKYTKDARGPLKVPAFTYPSAKYAAALLGIKYREVDVNRETYNVEGMRGMNCLVPTHLFGNPCEMTKVRGKFIIEDAACGIGSYYRGRHVGTIGEVGCFSLHSRKLLPAGEGGVLVTDLTTLAIEIRQHQKVQGLKISDLTATIGLIQLRHLPEILEKRRRQAQLYSKLITELEVPVNPQKTVEGGVHSYQAYVVTLPQPNREVMAKMAKEGIETQVGTYGSKKLPNSAFLCDRTLTLPLHHELTEEEQVYVIKTLKKVLTEKKRGN